MSQLIASNYLNKLWITFSSSEDSGEPSAAEPKTHHLTTSTMIGRSKWRMESVRAKTRTSSVAEIISLHRDPRPKGS
jgi:hypothetical protein